jgi:hypothetical protein
MCVNTISIIFNVKNLLYTDYNMNMSGIISKFYIFATFIIVDN